MPPAENHVQDVLLALGVLVLFSLPILLIVNPATFASWFQLFASLARTLLWLVVTLVVLVTVGGTALVGEKAYKRFVLDHPTRLDDADDDPNRIGTVPREASIEEERRMRRVTRETRMEQAAEKVVDQLERTRVGQLFRRKNLHASTTTTATTTTTSQSRTGKGKGKATNEDEIELDDYRGQGVSSGISRAPPPLPPRH